MTICHKSPFSTIRRELCFVLHCKDFNECDFNPCDENASCQDTFGSFTCACNHGYLGNGYICQGKIFTLIQFAYDAHVLTNQIYSMGKLLFILTEGNLYPQELN